jgi:hypothetical protein
MTNKQTVLAPEKKLVEHIKTAIGETARAKSDFNVFDALVEMRKALIDDLLERLRSGTATHQEMAIMARMLKENGLVLMPLDPEPQPELNPIGFTAVHTALPEFEDDSENGEFELDPLEELTPESDKEARESELD